MYEKFHFHGHFLGKKRSRLFLFVIFGIAVALLVSTVLFLQKQQDLADLAQAQVQAAGLEYVPTQLVAGVTWSSSERIQDFDLTSTGKPRLVYADSTTNALHYGSCDTDCDSFGNWTFVQILSGIDIRIEPALALDSSDNPRVIYKDHYLYCDASCTSAINWTAVNVGFGSTNDFNSLAITTDGKPRFVFGNNNDPASVLKYAQCDTTCSNPVNWTIITVDSTLGSGFFSSIVLTTDNKVRVAHTANISGSVNGVSMSFCDTSCDLLANWSTVVIDPGPITTQYTTIALNSSDNPRIFTGAGKYYFCDASCGLAGSWTATTVAGTTNTGTGYHKLLLTTTNNPRLLFNNGGIVTVAQCDAGCHLAGNWSLQSLVSWIPHSSNMVRGGIDSSNILHFSHFGNQSGFSGNLYYTSQFQQLGVVSVSPDQNADSVSAASNVVVVFDGSLNTATVNQTNLPFWGSQSGLIDGVYSFSTTTFSNDTVTFNPTSDFKVGETVQLSVSSNVESGSASIATPHFSEFVVESTIGAAIFFSAVNIDTNDAFTRQPTETEAADFDNDGDIDLAVSLGNGGTSGLGIYENLGTGTFDAGTIYATGSNPRRLEVADFDNDGFIDVSVVAQNSFRVDVFINNGDGTFAAAVNYTCTTECEDFQAVDVNMDGYKDLVVTVGGGDFIRILINDGDGTFAAGVDYVTNNPDGLAVGDYDNDGDPDIFVGSINSADIISYFSNNGNGTFGTKVDTFNIGNLGFAKAADFSGDGNLDAVMTDGNGGVEYYQGNGNGTFAAKVDTATGAGAYGLDYGDFDSDGDLDLAVAGSAAESVGVYRNNGVGVFTLSGIYPVDQSGLGISDVKTADLNGDGALDLVSSNQTAHSISILFADGRTRVDSVTPAPHAVDAAASANIVLVFNRSLTTASVTQATLPVFSNRRGLLDGVYSFSTTNVVDDTVTFNPDDVFLAGEMISYSVADAITDSGTDAIAPFYSDFFVASTAGTGTYVVNAYATGTNYATTSTGGSCAADFDGDGWVDIVVSDDAGGTDGVSFYQNSGAGVFAAPVHDDWTLSFGNQVICEDLNSDGFTDIAFSNGPLYVLLGNSDGTFALPSSYTLSDSSSGITAADFNGDGALDIAIGLSGNSSGMDVLLNSGTGTFGAATFVSAGGICVGHVGLCTGVLADGDFNNDGNADVVLQSGSSDEYVSILGNGDGTFQAPSAPAALTNNDYFRWLMTGDLNSDGNLDFVAINGTSGEFDVVLGNGNGTFQSVVLYELYFGGGASTHGSLGDIDGDGSLDVIIATAGANNAQVARNDGTGVFTAFPEFVVPGASYLSSVSSADFNNDGAVDLAYVDYTMDTLDVLINDIVGPAVTISQPNGGENLLFGSTYSILWSAIDASGSVRSVDLEYSVDNGSSWDPLASNLPFIAKWGGFGSGISQFENAVGVATDTDGFVYVADGANRRIQKFSSNGSFVSEWGSAGTGNGEFDYPFGVAVDAGGFVYVTDTNNDRVQKFTSTGVFVTTWGTSGSGDGQFIGPEGIAIDSSENVYVVDTSNSRVQKFTNSGGFLAKWGVNGSADGEFSYPDGIAIDSGNNVYVTDGSNYRVQKFSNTGVFISKWGSQGQGNGEFGYPYMIATDADDNIYVTDGDNYRVQQFDGAGVFITKWGVQGTDDGEFGYPVGIAVDATGYVYVVDTDNNRVQKFTPPGSYFWTVPATPTSLALIRATAEDFGGNIGTDDSNAVFTIVESSGGSSIQIIQQANLPVSPTAGVGEALAIDRIRWSFLDNSGNESGFRLIDDSAAVLVVVAQADQADINETGLQDNTSYSGRRIVAYNENGVSAPSNEFAAVTTLMPAVTAQVIERTDSSLTVGIAQTVHNLDQGQSGLQFELVDTATAAVLRVRASSILQSPWVQTTTYTFTGLQPAHDYNLRVRARNQAAVVINWSQFSQTQTTPPGQVISEPVPTEIAPVPPATEETPAMDSVTPPEPQPIIVLTPPHPGPTTVSNDGSSFNLEVTGSTTQIRVSGYAVLAEDRIEFTGTSAPNTTITLIFNGDVIVVVTSNAAGEWQTFVSAEQLGLQSGQERNIQIETIATSGDLQSARVPVGEVRVTLKSTGEIVGTFFTTLTDNVVATVLQEVREQVISAIEQNEPAIQTTLSVAAPVVIVSSVPLWGYLPHTPTILYHLLVYAAGAVGRKKRFAAHFYGVAYDSISKQPLSLAIIRIYKQTPTKPQAQSLGAAATTTKKLVTTVVTDKHGRYDALLQPGLYTLEVSKPGYLFPSQIVTAALDADYQYVYSANQGISVTGETFNIPNVPLDPVNAARQWQLASVPKKLWLAIQKLGSYLAVPILMVGAFTSTMVVVAVPDKPLNWIIATFYIVLLALQIKLRQKVEKAWGVVYDVASNAILPLVTIQLIERATSKVVTSRLSDYKGRFAFLPDPGQYVIKASKPGFTQVTEVVQSPFTDRQPLPQTIDIKKPSERVSGDVAMKQGV